MCSQLWLPLLPAPILLVKQKREVIARVAAPIKEEWQTNIHGPSKWPNLLQPHVSLNGAQVLTIGILLQLMTASVRACLP
jgi:hypothetical protein